MEFLSWDKEEKIRFDACKSCTAAVCRPAKCAQWVQRFSKGEGTVLPNGVKVAVLRSDQMFQKWKKEF